MTGKNVMQMFRTL